MQEFIEKKHGVKVLPMQPFIYLEGCLDQINRSKYQRYKLDLIPKLVGKIRACITKAFIEISEPSKA